jgi:hypothetical protein
MKKLIVLLAAALAIPTSVALAKGPPASPGKSAPKVQYILKGTLSGYTAFNSSTSTPGNITILVTRSNRHGKTLVGQTLTFTGGVTASTKVTLHDGATTISDGDRGIVKVRALKRIDPSALAATLETTPVRQIIDQDPVGS